MTIKAIGFVASDIDEVNNSPVSVRLIKLNWSAEQLRSVVEQYLGCYPSVATVLITQII